MIFIESVLCPFLHLFLGSDSGEVAPACQCGPLDWINQRPPLEPPGFKMVFVLLHHAVALKAAAFTQPLHDLHQPDLAADRGNKVPKQTCERGAGMRMSAQNPATKKKDVTAKLSSRLKMPAKLWLLPRVEIKHPAPTKRPPYSARRSNAQALPKHGSTCGLGTRQRRAA